MPKILHAHERPDDASPPEGMEVPPGAYEILDDEGRGMDLEAQDDGYHDDEDDDEPSWFMTHIGYIAAGVVGLIVAIVIVAACMGAFSDKPTVTGRQRETPQQAKARRKRCGMKEAEDTAARDVDFKESPSRFAWGGELIPGFSNKYLYSIVTVGGALVTVYCFNGFSWIGSKLGFGKQVHLNGVTGVRDPLDPEQEHKLLSGNRTNPTKEDLLKDGKDLIVDAGTFGKQNIIEPAKTIVAGAYDESISRGKPGKNTVKAVGGAALLGFGAYQYGGNAFHQGRRWLNILPFFSAWWRYLKSCFVTIFVSPWLPDQDAVSAWGPSDFDQQKQDLKAINEDGSQSADARRRAFDHLQDLEKEMPVKSDSVVWERLRFSFATYLLLLFLSFASSFAGASAFWTCNVNFGKWLLSYLS